MVETSFNLFDAVVLGILVLSTLLSFFRGFVREVLSLSAWVAAAFLTLIYAPDLAAWIKNDIDHGPAALLVASMALFFGAKIVLSILNMLLMRLLKKGKEVGVLDNILGLFFGVFRAALLVSLGYYVYSFVASEENQPEWIAASETRPYVAQGAQLLAPLLEDFLTEIAPMLEDRAEQAQPGSVDAMRMLLEQASPPGEAVATPEMGYDPMNAQDMQRLLDQKQQLQENEQFRELLKRQMDLERQQWEQQPANPAGQP